MSIPVEPVDHSAEALYRNITHEYRPQIVRVERGLGLTVWGDGLNAAQVRNEDCQIVRDLTPRADEYLIEKPRHSAFF